MDALDDKTLVEAASRWLMDHSRFEDGFTTYTAELVDGAVRVHPLLAEHVRESASERGLTVEELWQRELFAKDMLRLGVHGSCTSSAIYLEGGLRSVGVPTRIVLAVPLIDASDEREVALLDRLRHPMVRRVAKQGTSGLGRSWASHTFDEVWVNGRWRRLNYAHLGQGILDPDLFGMLTHVATFSDWLDGDMASTWGVREILHGSAPDAFGGANPYSTVALSDRFGVHSGLDPATIVDEGDFHALTIERAYWYDDPAKDPIVTMSLDDSDLGGHVLVHVREFHPGEGTRQYGPFWNEASRSFALRAPGHEDVPLRAARGWWYDEAKSVREFYLSIAEPDYTRMEPLVAYALVPLAPVDGRRWNVAEGVTLTRPAPAERGGDETADGRATLTLDAVAWSDAPDSPIGPIQGAGRLLLLRMGAREDFPAHKAFTAACDRVLLLEAEGHPTVEVSTGVGGYTSARGSYAMASPVQGDWSALVPGVTYTLRPRNQSRTHAWRLAHPLTIVP